MRRTFYFIFQTHKTDLTFVKQNVIYRQGVQIEISPGL